MDRKYRGKILICEDGDRGHRPVILGYVKRVLEEHGIAYEISNHSQADVRGALSEARRRNCTGIHFLTVDGAIRNWLSGWVSLDEQMPAVATYYLFSNIYNWLRAPLLGMACEAVGVRALLISDDFMAQRMRPFFGPSLEFIPDPWCSKEFPLIAQADARKKLGIDERSVVFLMFGELTARKGFDLFILSLAQISTASGLRAICAGRIAPEVYKNHGELLDRLVRSGILVCFDRFIEEAEVAYFFGACDFVVCPYPSHFKVSSNTSTRALAAGRPYITFNHGLIAEYARVNRCGLVISGRPSASALYHEIQRATEFRSSVDYQEMSDRGKRIIKSREFSQYGRCLVDVYLRMGLVAGGEWGQVL